MDKIYQFKGYDRFKINVLLLLSVISIAFVLFGISKGIVYFLGPLTMGILITLSITLAFAYLISMILYSKMEDRSSMEEWMISFNLEKMEVSSNKRPKKEFLISQITKVDLFKDKALHIKKSGIAISFKTNEGKNQKIRIEVSITFFSKVTKKNNFNHFSLFLNDFEKQILKEQFKQVKSWWIRTEATYVSQ